MTEPMGVWTNAPLAYVLAEVRTEQLADIKTYYDTLAGQLREQFPVQRRMHAARLVTTGSSVRLESENDSVLEFVAPDNLRGVIIRPSGLVLHSTRYSNFQEFVGCLSSVVGILHKVVPHIYVNRLGLRYIDFVIPRPNEAPEMYVDRRLNPELNISTEAGCPVTTSLSVYPREGGQLVLRYMRGPGQPGLPPDLATVSLGPSQPMIAARNVPPTQTTAILDTDRISEFGTPILLEPESVIRQFQAMRDDVSRAFKAIVITEHARAAWGAA